MAIGRPDSTFNDHEITAENVSKLSEDLIKELIASIGKRIICSLKTGKTCRKVVEVSSLTNMHIRVPEAVRIGETVTLVCDYDLESAALYTIKWYRNDEEFYRFVPKESPPSQMFEVPNINVDMYNSNTREVTLTNVEKETSGEFKCEVTADAPLFHTDIRMARLLVADIPEDGPVLKTEVQKITPGAELKANCTTPGSYPAMNVSWYINDIEMRSSFDVHIQKSIVHFDALPGLETVQSTITARTTPEHFKSSKLKLRCLATMFTLYTSSREAEIQEDAPKLALIMVQNAQSNEASSQVSKISYSALLKMVLLFTAHLRIWLRI